MECYICHNKEVFLVMTIDGRDIYECGCCRTRFVSPIEEYHGDYVANNLYNRNYGWLTFHRQSIEIKKIKSAGRILDFGCGGGHFLSHMGNRWQKYGCEVSKEASDVARTKGIRVFDSLEPMKTWDDFFDVITMFAVVEHLMTPKDLIGELSRLLKPEGLFVIMTGDVTSKKAISKGDKWHMYISPEHFYFFSAKAIDMIMAESGLIKSNSYYTDGGMYKVPLLDKVPVLNRLPLFDHYYAYFNKERVDEKIRI